MKNLVASACSFSSSEQELLDLGFSDHNPFCENNRDPGATGNDQCFGVKELNNPFHSSNSTKTGNLRAVLQGSCFSAVVFYLRRCSSPQGPLVITTTTAKKTLRACLHGGGGPQVGEVTPVGGVKQ